MIYYLKLLLAIVIVYLVIALLNKKGISAGNFRKNFPLKSFLVLVLLGIFMRIMFLFSDLEYIFKDTIEPVVSVTTIYLILAIINKNGLLDKQKINNFVGALLTVGGVVILLTITLI